MQQNRTAIISGLCLLLLAAVMPAVGDAAGFRWSGVERIVAFGDVHGAYDELTDLLQDAGVIDENLNWIGGSTHAVSVGDLVDRGAQSRKVLDLLMRLQQEAPASGGYFHVLLGNHEVMNMTGELEYVSDAEFAAFAGEEDQTVRDRVRKKYLRERLDTAVYPLDESEPPGSRQAAFDRFLEDGPAGTSNSTAVDADAPPAATPLEYFLNILNEAAASFDDLRPPGYFGHQVAFSPTGDYGKWLLTLPFMIVINDTVFVHGGLPPGVADDGLEAINESLAHDLKQYMTAWNLLVDAQVLVPDDSLDQRPALAAERIEAKGLDQPLLEAVDQLEAVTNSDLFLDTGPTWYRGTALCFAMHDSEVAQAALDRLKASRVAMGHTPTLDAVMRSRLSGRAIMMDTGMLTEVYKGQPSALIIAGNEIRALYGETGELLPIETEPRRVGWRPQAVSDDELEDILRTGEIIAAEEVEDGTIKSLRLTIAGDGFKVKALFKSKARKNSSSSGPAFTDNYKNEVAAYRLDRLIELDMVPVTVIREYEGKTGSLQFWIDNLVNEIDRNEWGVGGTDWCRLEDQWNLLYVFDALIHNTDRTMQNMTYEEPDWMLRLIDHSRSFSTRTGRPSYLKRVELKISDDLRMNLAALDYDTLEAELSPLLSSQEIRALLKRRDRMLND